MKGVEGYLTHQQKTVEYLSKMMCTSHIMSRLDGIADIYPVALGIADDTSFRYFNKANALCAAFRECIFSLKGGNWPGRATTCVPLQGALGFSPSLAQANRSLDHGEPNKAKDSLGWMLFKLAEYE